MNRVLKPLQILVYQDVLCAWCFIADQRLEPLRKEFAGMVTFRHRPYPLRLEEAPPSDKEVRDWVDEIKRARKEPEGLRLTDSIWTTSGADSPRSSVSALAALEAAKLQGAEKRDALARSLQRAALEQGINVTRPDVVFELASALGLDMNRFAAAYEAPQTRRLILEEHALAADRGVKGVPALVIGGRWMLSGLKETAEYREHILRCLEKASLGAAGSPERLIH